MAVEMLIDHWNPSQKRYRTETFCCGPLSCRLYKAGPTRMVPGRKGMSWEEEDWVDEESVAHRDPDERSRRTGSPVIESVRLELLNHVRVRDVEELQWYLDEYRAYHNGHRVSQALGGRTRAGFGRGHRAQP